MAMGPEYARRSQYIRLGAVFFFVAILMYLESLRHSSVFRTLRQTDVRTTQKAFNQDLMEQGKEALQVRQQWVGPGGAKRKAVKPPSSKSNKQVRQVSLWLARENGAVVEVFVVKSKNSPFSVLYLDLPNSMLASQSISYAEKLLKKLGITDEKVEFLKAIKKGPAQDKSQKDGSKFAPVADLWSYVSMVTPKNAEAILQSAFSKAEGGRFVPISKMTTALTSPENQFRPDMRDDLPDVIEFLTPIIKTAGKNPAKCLGPPPGWRKKLQRKLPWPRVRHAGR